MNEQWYYGQDGKQSGPIDTATLRQLATTGQLRPTDLVWRDGMAEWTPAANVADLAGAFPVASSANASGWNNPQPLQYAPASPQNGRATTAMWLGISSIVISICCPLAGLGLGIGAVSTAASAKQATNLSAVKAGTICGIVGIVLSIGNAILGIALRLNS